MAAIRTATIVVKPDLSAFRQADTEEIAEILEIHLLQHLPRRFNRGDMRMVVRALEEQFNILPR
jgi:hypothetical protein